MTNFHNNMFHAEDIVYDHNRIQTSNMKWLLIKDIYPKLIMEGDYDIGGTYHTDVADYWFMFSTERFGDNYILHIFIGNRHENSFTIHISDNSELTHLPMKKNETIARSHLSLYHKNYEFNNAPNNAYNYIKSFSFNSLDVKHLENRELFISVQLMPGNSKCIDQIAKNVKLNHDLEPLLQDPIYSDFIIESCDGHQFSVHRAVLASHSEVFKAMLKKETAESQNSKVQLHNSKDEVESLLHFIYTGTISEKHSHDFRALLMLADEYNLPSLAQLAQYGLRVQLDCDNAVEMVILGDMYNSNLLKNYALKYIKENPRVLKGESWKLLQDLSLIKSICEFMYK